jgi:autotransporter-associated beta strand protein
MHRLIHRFLGLIVGLAAANAPAQYFYTVTDLGLYAAQDIYGPTTNVAGWEVSTYTSSFPLNSYSLVKRPGDAGFSELFPSAYLYLDAAYGINDRNMIVGATHLFYSTNYGYRADGNVNDMLRLTDITSMGVSGITNIERATRILDNGTIIGLGRTGSDAIHVVQLTPIAPELHWDANGATTGLPQGSGTWSHGSGNWTTNTVGTSVAGWTDGAIARFYYNNAPTTITVTDNVVLEGLWASYSPNALTIDASGGGTLTFTGQGFIRMAGSPSNLTISAPIAGSAGLSVTGQSDLFLEGNNTYTGVTEIRGSDVYVRHQNALGATGAGNETVLNDSSRLRLDRNLTVAETLVLNGGSIYLQPDYSLVESRAVTLAGPIVLQAASSQIGGATPDYNATLTVSGVISESGGSRNLLVSGATLTGTNTFTGDLITEEDGVTISQVTDAGVAGQMGQGNRIVLGVQGEGTSQGDFHYTGSTASTNREFYLEGGGSIDVVNAGTTLTLSGLISGSQDLGKSGAGTLTLTGANTYTGGTQVTGGTLRLTNTTGSALGTGSVTIDPGATLTGSGTFTGDLSIGGLYSPGDSPALITLPGSIMLGSSGFIEFEIGGLVRGTQYDAIDIGGMFSSEGSIRLTLINGFMPGLGDSFNLLDWGTAGSISFLSFDTSALTGGLYWDTSLIATTGVVSVTDIAPAIPEPSTYAVLAGLAALGLAAWRRRRA